MTLDLHGNIKETLGEFIKTKKIPNIIFHGPYGSGKRTLVSDFIRSIYNNDESSIKNYTMNVNCAHGKGIKFVREDLKFFAKSHINVKSTNIFKIIIMANADKLTMDAQSALRRCIELYNHTTRFFIIVENKYKLLKPILSRFCEIYISCPNIDGVQVNLNKFFIEKHFGADLVQDKRDAWLCTYLNKATTSNTEIIKRVTKLYEKGYSGLDIFKYIENKPNLEERVKWKFLLIFHKIKKEFRNEGLIMYFMLYYIYLRSTDSLENILNM